MLFALRPSIGWLGYIFVSRKSKTTLCCIVLAIGMISLMLVQRSQYSLTLQFMTTAPGLCSVIILPPPEYQSLNSFDACAVEAAINPSLSLSEHLQKTKGTVYLYLWYSNVGPNDVWVHVLSKIKGVKILYMNLVKTIKNTPARGILNMGGWGGKPSWAIWLASGGSLLWRSGGIVMPTGVLVTKPVSIESFGDNNTGLLVTKEKRIKPIILGSPPHHSILANILNDVQNFDHDLYDNFVYTKDKGTPMENLLTNAVSKVCDVSDMKNGVCEGFRLIDSDMVYDMNLEMPSSLQEESAQFIRFTGDPDVLKYDLGMSKMFFRRHGLIKYCPKVYEFLHKEAKSYL